MLKSTYTPLPPLPPGWTEHRAPSGHLYYYNAETKQSTYKRPTAPTPETKPTVFSPEHPPLGLSAAVPGASPANVPFGGAFRFGACRKDDPGSGRRYEKRQPQDRPKSKHPIPGCPSWFLVKTKLGRRFVHNPGTNESFWKFPEHVLKGVVEYDRIERERNERRERGELSEGEDTRRRKEPLPEKEQTGSREAAADEQEEEYSDEYEEVEVTDEEDELRSKRLRTEEGIDQPIEFNEDDIAYQLAAMGEDYGLDPGEYGEPGEEGWEEGAEGLPLTEEDATALFRDLLDDYRINPYTPWEKIIEEGRIIDDTRYTILPNMKSRREAWSNWSRDRIQEHKERKEKGEKKDPRIRYLALLEAHATPKLFWAEFKRKYRKEPEMKDNRMSDKDREKLYRDHISRLKLPESTRKSDFSAFLKSIPLTHLNRSSTIDALDSSILTDIRYISLPSKVRNPLIETYVSTLPDAPEVTDLSVEEKEEKLKKHHERQRREKALADRKAMVQEEKQKHQRALVQGKGMLRHGDEELRKAMLVGKEGLTSHLEEIGKGNTSISDEE
ncbi:FF domain-containing protein [Coccidioides immitis RS]|uniref:FF domain-containing protein n=1 Tax=Coccidioides immitis (strain RS) TaxID=246410 RepID=A0A0E1RYN1_COCIM|nr:FF domain-containing protein [Coccidioides immitis RS]EAS35983.2 FF domain-containing protein [Coccidioides immitis RS]TPX25835.1 hypothetical protein DIZ76_011292 [Coccidioides immitis]